MTQQLNNNVILSCVKCLFRSLPMFFLLGWFLISEFWEFFVFSPYTFFRRWYSASNSSRLCLSFRAVSFTCQKLYILMISNLSFLHVIVKFLSNLRLQWFSLVFSSRSIIVLTLTFRPIIQLELIFLVKVHILSMNVQSVQRHSLKRLSFVHGIAFAHLSKSNDCMCVDIFLDNLFSFRVMNFKCLPYRCWIYPKKWSYQIPFRP